MRVTKELIKNVVTELVGPDAVDAVMYLLDKQNVSEFIVSEDLDMEIHQTRNILYRCYEHNILTFKRKKDKKKGWYICYWNFNRENIPHVARKIKSTKLARMKDRLKAEEANQYYICKNACTRMDFEKSVEYDFHCPECNEIMHLQDNTRTIEFLTARIEELEAAKTF